MRRRYIKKIKNIKKNKKHQKKYKRKKFGKGFFTGYANLLTKIIKKTL